MAASMCARVFASVTNKYVHCSHLTTTCSMGAGHQWRTQKGLSGNYTKPGNPITDSPDWSYADGRPGCLTHRQKLRVLKQMDYAEKIIELVKDVDFAVDYELNQKAEQQAQRQETLDNKLRPKGALLESGSSSKSRRRPKKF